MSSIYKLTYFNGRARAELTRLIFNAAGVKFIDERISYDTWLKEGKKNSPIGQLPYLTIDNTVRIAQSLAIARFVALRVKLAGNDDVERAKTDAVVLTTHDLQSVYYARVHPHKKDATRIDEIKKSFFQDDVPVYLDRLERLAGLYGTRGYSCGDGLKWSDLAIFDTLSVLFFIDMNHALLQAYPRVEEIFKTVENNPRIKAYVKSRSVTSF